MEIYDGGLPGILRLTPETRRRIYRHAGLGLRQFYGITAPGIYDLGDRSGFQSVREQYGVNVDEGFQSFHGLLLSCRTIYTEAAALLYSANRFVIRYHNPHRSSLEALRALTPLSLASLTNLKIVLNQVSCHQQASGNESCGDCCNGLWGYESYPGGRKLVPGCMVYHRYNHDLPFRNPGPLAEAMLADWHATATYLASHITPGKLELAFVCDIDHRGKAIETAKFVLDGLRLLPRLKYCHIRLCRTPDSQLQQLTQEAALQARGIVFPQPSASLGIFSHRLDNLPREIRLRILTYTDLVTPWKEVEWSRRSYGYRIERGECSAEHCEPEFHHGCQFHCCWKRPFAQPSIGCFCRRRHTAFSSECKCWAPPTPLFLICRTLHSDASVVFYGQNRFIIVDSPETSGHTPWPPVDYPYDSFAASHFIRRVVPGHCLGYIHFIELVFSPFTHLSRPRDGHPALQDWAETLEWAKDKLNLPALTLRLIMAANHDYPPEGSNNMTRAQGKEVLTTYNRVLAPIQQHWGPTRDGSGLVRFFAQLAWPLQWADVWAAERQYKKSPWPAVQAKERELKRRAEQFVMGERYERVCVEGREPQGSVWTWSRLY